MALQNTARAKQQSRNRLIIIVVLVLLVLGGAAFFLLSGKSPASNQQSAERRPTGMVAVPILAKDVALGNRIKTSDLTVTYAKPDEVPTDAVLSVRQFLNRRAVRNLNNRDYIKESDFAEAGANQGYSGVARYGKRVVALPESIFQSFEALRPGDHIDLLSIGTPLGVVNSSGRRGRGRTLEDSVTSIQGGGAQPGDPNSGARRRNRARTSSAVVNATTATLIAENAEILSTNNKMVIMQMEPQDAHVTQLAAASGALMRIVFRPFSDPSRLTPNPDVSVTTRMPKPSGDPDSVIVFNAGERSVTNPTSNLYRPDGNNSSRFNPEADNGIFPVIINVD